MIPATFPPKDEIARLTARAFLDIGAVHFNAREPFTLASGLPSPTYIDCRKLISYPRIRSMLMDFLATTVMREAGFEAFDNIAGGETAGIPFAALVAERLALPMTYVRKKPKGYGRNARIEGAMTEGQRVLLVEDLTTDGGSKLSFVDAIRATGATCGHTAVIFYYGIFPKPRRGWPSMASRCIHLCTWWDMLAEARARRLRRRDAGRGGGLPERPPRLAGRPRQVTQGKPAISCRPGGSALPGHRLVGTCGGIADRPAAHHAICAGLANLPQDVVVCRQAATRRAAARQFPTGLPTGLSRCCHVRV
jgi:orotate phosphoribosyltransferase